VGTGTAIVEVGRPILVSYVVAGLLLLGILYLSARMRKLLPGALFITDFVHLGLGDVAECIAGWIYWFFWTLLVAIEALAGANILAPEGGLAGLLAAIVLLALTAAIGEKRLSVSLSELEMGFAGLKVAIITAFILFTLFHVVGRQPSFALSRWRHSIGVGDTLSVLAGVVTTFFSLAGVEIAHTVATPPACSARDSTRAFRLISVRVFGIYLASIALILTIVPASTIRPGFSPFTLTLRALDHPQVASWLSVVILIGVLTTLNTGLAIGARLLGNFARGHEPRGSRRYLTGAIALAVLCGAAHWPGEAYAYLVKSASALLVIVYLLFVLATSIEAVRADSKQLWIGPLLVASLTGVLLSMAWLPESQGSLTSALCLVALVALLAAIARHARVPSAPR
jgi:GABA permease